MTVKNMRLQSTYPRASSKYKEGFFGSVVLSSSNHPFNAKIYHISSNECNSTKDTETCKRNRLQ